MARGADKKKKKELKNPVPPLHWPHFKCSVSTCRYAAAYCSEHCRERTFLSLQQMDSKYCLAAQQVAGTFWGLVSVLIASDHAVPTVNFLE